MDRRLIFHLIDFWLFLFEAKDNLCFALACTFSWLLSPTWIFFRTVFNRFLPWVSEGRELLVSDAFCLIFSLIFFFVFVVVVASRSLSQSVRFSFIFRFNLLRYSTAVIFSFIKADHLHHLLPLALMLCPLLVVVVVAAPTPFFPSFIFAWLIDLWCCVCVCLYVCVVINVAFTRPSRVLMVKEVMNGQRRRRRRRWGEMKKREKGRKISWLMRCFGMLCCCVVNKPNFSSIGLLHFSFQQSAQE